MYEPLLLIHSWTRWVVFFALVYLFVRCLVGWIRKSDWDPSLDSWIYAFNQAFGLQVAFGITLWFAFSPMAKAGFKDPSSIFENGMVWFWFVQHPLTMIMALILFFVGHSRSRKAAVGAGLRHRAYGITFGIVLALIFSAIPWPWAQYGRALFYWRF